MKIRHWVNVAPKTTQFNPALGFQRNGSERVNDASFEVLGDTIRQPAYWRVFKHHVIVLNRHIYFTYSVANQQLVPTFDYNSCVLFGCCTVILVRFYTQRKLSIASWHTVKGTTIAVRRTRLCALNKFANS